MNTITATEFKAKCLAILDRVRDTGERIVVLKHGKPVAQLGPVYTTSSGFPQDELRGTVDVRGDIVGPVVAESDWESVSD